MIIIKSFEHEIGQIQSFTINFIEEGPPFINLNCSRIRLVKQLICHNHIFMNNVVASSSQRIPFSIVVDEDCRMVFNMCWIMEINSTYNADNEYICEGVRIQTPDNYLIRAAVQRQKEEKDIFTYCFDCGSKIYKPQLKCWACENGI